MKKEQARDNGEPTPFDVRVDEPQPYEFEITLLTKSTKDTVTRRARRSQVSASGAVASFIGPPLIRWYRARHGGIWPDIRTTPAVSGHRARNIRGDRHVIPIENTDIREILDELQALTLTSRAELVKTCMMDALEQTLEPPRGSTSVH